MKVLLVIIGRTGVYYYMVLLSNDPVNLLHFTRMELINFLSCTTVNPMSALVLGWNNVPDLLRKLLDRGNLLPQSLNPPFFPNKILAVAIVCLANLLKYSLLPSNISKSTSSLSPEYLTPARIKVPLGNRIQ